MKKKKPAFQRAFVYPDLPTGGRGGAIPVEHAYGTQVGTPCGIGVRDQRACL